MAVAMIPSPSLESNPLRLLAHSVAEAALASDPSSPSLPQSWARFNDPALDVSRRVLRADAAPFRAHSRTRSDDAIPSIPLPSQLLRAQARSACSSPTKASFEVKTRLPSLKQIQARVGTHKRASSIDEFQRPATPPSPTRESRLPTFLRERAPSKPRPISMPPRQPDVQVYIIPPTLASPTSPTGSLSSMTSSSTASSSSSTRRVPMITCTDAGSDSDEVLVVPTLEYTHTQDDSYFALETRREEKAREMKLKLGLRARTERV